MRNVQKLIPWLLLAAASVLLVVLGMQHRSLRGAFLEHRRADRRLQVASYVPTFAGISVAGDSVTVGAAPDEGRQVLFFLTSTCPFCRQTLPSWTQLAGRLAALPATEPRVQVVALTTDSMTVAVPYAQSNKLPFALVPFPSRKHVSLYRAFSVPQTVVIDSEGRVLFARNGVIDTPAAVDSVMAAALKPAFGGADSTAARVSGSSAALPLRTPAGGRSL